VELGKPEAVGLLDDHHRRVGDVDADLDHRRRDEHVELARLEAGHEVAPVGSLEPPWRQPTRKSRSSARRSRSASSSAARASDVSDASISGQTTYACRPSRSSRVRPRVRLRRALLGDPARDHGLARRRRLRDLETARSP
jgi:hypothetical protein